MKRKVLVVDDNSIERAVLSKILKSEYDVIEASSGEEAIGVLLRQYTVISAIISDIIMPGMGGYDMMRRIRENYIFRQIPIIVATGLEDDDSRAKAIAHGANGFITKPYNSELLIYSVKNVIMLRESAAVANSLWRDSLTGLLNRESFFIEAKRLLLKHEPGYFMLSCFDIENFKYINDQYGTEKGDEVLVYVAHHINDFVAGVNGLTCRFNADRFAILYPASLCDSDEILENHRAVMEPDCINRSIHVRIGRYLVDDLTLSVNTMFDRAVLAEESIKGKYKVYIANFTPQMQQVFEHEQQIVSDMETALNNGEFHTWLQPQYNHATGALIGAEVLVRWISDGKFISPGEFIPIFEKNGFIYTLDRYIWEKACQLLRRWIDSGISPLPISVNISRRDLQHKDFAEKLTKLVEKYNIPFELLRLEVTESAFSDEDITSKVRELIGRGFTVEIDDFGSGYSSLNTLKDVPAAILKLDMRFFENTDNKQRGGNIIESVVRMAKWLDMAVIAEGVEEKAQADYLKSIGCYYIQGYYYARPMPAEDYEALLVRSAKEPELIRLKTLETLDNNEFWNPKSMETLIFNSYVGGACIFEYNAGSFELLRVNDQYIGTFGGMLPEGAMLVDASMAKFVDAKDREKLKDIVVRANETKKEAACELCVRDGDHTEYVRVTVRVIARNGERLLCYGVVYNLTEQRAAERNEKAASERVQAVMNNSPCGITARIMHEDGTKEYLFVNTRFYQLLGYTREQFAKEIPDPFSRILREDYEETMNRVEKLDTAGQTLTVLLRAVRRDEAVIWLRADISIVRFANVKDPVQLASFTDVTEQVVAEQQRLAAEKKQNESARKLEIIMSNVNGGVSATQISDEGTSSFVFCNDRYYDLYGYTKEQVEREHIDVMTRILTEDFPGVMAKIRKLKQDGQPTIIDYRIRKQDGTLAFLRANSSLMSLEGYGDDVIASVLIDISEKKSLEDQLRAIVENINGGVTATIVKNGQPEFVIVNDQFFRILGYDTREQYETECPDKFSRIHSDDRERIIEQFSTSDGGKQQFSMDYRVIRRDGDIRYIRNNISVITMFGFNEPVQLSLANDITEQRRAEIKERNIAKQLSAIVSNIHGGVTASLMVDTQHVKLIFANEGFYEMYGYTRESLEAEMPDTLDLILPEDREKTMKTVARIIRERGCETYEYRCRKRDGSVMWTQVTNTVISLENVSDTVLLAVSRDITEEKEATNQLRYLNETAHEILAQPDSELAIRAVLQRLLAYHAADRAYVVELDEEKMLSRNTYEVCADGVESEQEGLQAIPFSPSDFWYDSLMRNEFFLVESVEQLPEEQEELRQLLAQQKIRSMILAPVWRDGRLIGFVGVDNPAKTIKKAERLKAMGDYIAVLLTRRDMGRSIKRRDDDIKRLIDDTPGGFCRIAIYNGRSPTLVSMNAGFARMLGMTEEEVFAAYGDDMFKCFADDLAGAVEEGRSAYFNGSQFSTKCRLRKKDGELLWVMLFGRFVREEEGICLNSYFTDITKQKRTEFELETLLKFIPSGVLKYSADEKGELAYVNSNFVRTLGYTQEQFREKFHNSFRELIWHEDRERAVKDILASESGGKIGKLNYRVEAADGSLRWVHDEGVRITDHEGRAWYYVTLIDVTEQKEAEASLRLAEEEYRIAASHSGHTIGRYNIADRTLTITAAAATRLELPECIHDVPYGRVKLGKISDDTAGAYIGLYESVMRGEKEASAVYKKQLSGKWRWICEKATTIFDDTGKPVSAIVSYVDVTEQQEKEAAYRKWQQTLNEKAPETYTLFRCNLNKNAGFDSMEGTLIDFKVNDTVEMAFNERTRIFAAQRVAEEDRNMYVSFLNADILLANYYRGKRSGSIEFRGRINSGAIHWLRLSVELVEYPNSTDVEAYLMFEDINAAKLEELQTKEQAETDPLTGLLNRKTFETRLRDVIAAQKPGRLTALLLLDMDGFKLVNDNFGHSVGDHVLVDAASTLRSAVYDEDLVCRLGGDEFLVCLNDMPGCDTVMKKARRLCALTRRTLGFGIRLTVSIGIAVCPEHGTTFDELYHKADKALYQVKGSGKNSCLFYNEEMSGSKAAHEDT